MPEISYISLACKKLNVDPQSLLKFHEFDTGLYVITAEGKKISFTFEELEDYKQYLKDNTPKKVASKRSEITEEPKEEPKKSTKSPTSPSKPKKDTK